MAAVAQTAMTLGETLSGIFGSISLTAWIYLLLPQLITNYRAKSANALSMKFLFIWLLGDVTNLSGALCSSLAPSAIALASYFCVADLILIGQCTYYNTINARRRHAASYVHLNRDSTEDESLLPHRRSVDSALPGSQRRHSIRASESNLDPLTRIITGENDTSGIDPWLHNALSLAAVWGVGVAAWVIGYESGVWTAGEDQGLPLSHPLAAWGQVLGYASALFYLCARIPQIMKNWREKSTEGLAILFFLLSLTGNLTYGASLVAFSQKKQDLIKALPWLLGSLGTIVEDSIIFVQFQLYTGEGPTKTNDAV